MAPTTARVCHVWRITQNARSDAARAKKKPGSTRGRSAVDSARLASAVVITRSPELASSAHGR
jgi:hypothetical protein